MPNHMKLVCTIQLIMEKQMADKIKGKVKWFNKDKGFGFIESNRTDYFVHFSAIQTSGFKNLCEGENVLFKMSKGQKGLQAEEVEVIK